MITEDTVLLYEDESHIRSYQVLRSTWAEVGKQKQIPTYGHHVSVTLFGVVNVLDGDVLCMQSDTCNAEAFLSFLQKTLERYPENYIVMVLDNARIHHAKLIQPFLEENKERLYLMFLPPYSPHLNPIERLWKWMKESVIANRFHKNKNEIQKSIDSFLEGIKDCTEQVLQRIGCLPEMSKC
ncbi:IS630 family transposase [Aneurinibacillus thermoaerophilus]|uniref:IS630 family transposase n=1 Tax=Aneurinibacillus thermoaerophilus TaxID=143495 RepID=A0ABX8YCN4_ANETH|nr:MULTISPECIES: IS630 family transposase [Aneurinibacillus]MED0676192.1 IS630 family transposase [Aneurinibacillus thermoaerophilus]QYY43473.1 IS630 family transposase [Aneurinibacillus thermoaerophilus]